MFEDFLKSDVLKIHFTKNVFSKVIQDYSFIHIPQNFTIVENQNLKIDQNIRESQVIMIYYYSLAANQNFPQAQFNLGLIYHEGKYVTRDIDKAIHYYSLAANQNHHGEQFILGFIYYIGENVKQDTKKGRYYIMLASKNGCRMANFAHGFLLHEGKNKRLGNAIEYFEGAIRQKSDYLSMYNLAHIHIYDETIKQDIKKSRHVKIYTIL